MKKCFGFLILMVFGTVGCSAFAQVAAPEAEFLQQLAGLVAGDMGWVFALFTFMGAARAVFKPLMTLAHSIVDQTPTVKDNEMLAKLEASRGFKIVAFLLDYFASVKIKK